MRIIISVFCLVAFSVCGQEIVRDTDRFEFTYEVTVPEIKKSGRMWVPLATSDRFQKVAFSIHAPVKPRELVDAGFGNRILFAELLPEHGGKKFTVRYTVERRENRGFADTNDVSAFLKPSRLVPLNPELKELARKASAETRDDEARGRALYWHTLERMRYDKSGIGWGRGDALYACDARTGNCTDFHSYFIALARSMDIPARFAIGFTIPADRDEGVIGGYHCWAEFNAKERWLPIDISEADKQPELKHYYLGNHPANRFQFTVGRDLVVDPAPASGPINFLVYPLFEVDGGEVRAEHHFSFRRPKK